MELFIGLFLLLVVLVMGIVLFRGDQGGGSFEDTMGDSGEQFEEERV